MTVSLNELSSVYREFISEEDNTPEAVAQRVAQMVKAIRYRARKEGSPLSKAFNDYIGSVNATSVERQSVKEKLGLTGGATHKEEIEIGEAVYGGTKKKEEPKDTRYTVTQADKTANTKAYQNYKAGDKRYKAADHLGEENLEEKAVSKAQQRFMGMVHAVKKGKMEAPSAAVAKAAASMTGKEAEDFAKTKHKGLPGKVKVKESFSNWRQDLSEVMTDIESEKKIKEKKVKNKVTINPVMKEAVQELGGEVLDVSEIDEGIGMTMANAIGAIGNPPTVSKRMQLKRALLQREIEKNARKNKEKKYSGKAATQVREQAPEEATMSPQELQLQRKKAQIQLMIAKQRKQQIQKMK